MFLPSCACSLAHLSRDIYSNLRNLPAIGYQFFQGDPGLCWGSSAFLIVDLTFHGQWHILPVGRRPSCSGSFAFFRSCTGFTHWTGASVEVVLASTTIVLPSCACYLAHLSPDLYSKYGCTRITTVGQSPAAMV